MMSLQESISSSANTKLSVNSYLKYSLYFVQLFMAFQHEGLHIALISCSKGTPEIFQQKQKLNTQSMIIYFAWNALDGSMLYYNTITMSTITQINFKKNRKSLLVILALNLCKALYDNIVQTLSLTQAGKLAK